MQPPSILLQPSKGYDNTQFGGPVQQLVYALQFKGHGQPESDTVFQVQETAVSASITTVVNSGGLTGGFDPAAVVEASFRSRVELAPDGTFDEQGTISFGQQHRFRFRTKVRGWLDQGPEPKFRHGTVTFEVVDGEGQFTGAAGLITSNFTITSDGEITEHHMGVIYIR